MRGKRKGKDQGDPEAAMAYLRRLHGDPSVTPDNAPVGDLAELAEREQTPDSIEKNIINNRRQAQ